MFSKSISKLLMGLSLAILLILVGCGRGTEPQSSWKAPTVSEFRRASEWGLQVEGPEKIEPPWTVCESGPCQVSLDTREGPVLYVATPLAITAARASTARGLDEETLVDLREQFSNELVIVLIFDGTTRDLYTSYEAAITQGDLVIHPFQTSLDSPMETREQGDMGVTIWLECRLKIKDLDPDKPFWFSATQAVGSQRFEFKIDPNSLGTEEFF